VTPSATRDQTATRDHSLRRHADLNFRTWRRSEKPSFLGIWTPSSACGSLTSPGATTGLRQYGFRLPIGGFVERDLRTLAKFQRPDGRLLLAISGDDAVGIACMQRIGPETAEIKRMYVDPLHRRGGLGRTMLAQLITEAQLTGYKRVRLDSPDFMTAAHSLYRASGFKDIGPYPESEIPDEYKPHWVFMERNLI
jgi:GNAT superfamily N-acetyltransferase